MFTHKWWYGGKVVSDEGFSIEWGRDTLLYRENGRVMSVTVDCAANGIDLFADSVSRWDDDASTRVDDATRGRIVDNIFRALTFYYQRRNGEVELRD